MVTSGAWRYLEAARVRKGGADGPFAAQKEQAPRTASATEEGATSEAGAAGEDTVTGAEQLFTVSNQRRMYPS